MLLIHRLLCLLALLCSVGCVDHGRWQTLSQSHAPWIGPASRGELQERVSAFYIPFLPIPPSGWWEYRYVDPVEDAVFDPVDVGQRVEAFLREHGRFEVQLKPSHRDHRRFVEEFERWEAGKEPEIAIPLVTPFRMTLVSLDPVVVLLTHEMSLYNEDSYLMLMPPGRGGHLPTDDAGMVDRRGLVGGLPILPGGAIPRTRLTMSRQVQWFSPTLKTAPTPLVFGAEGVAEIPVPWGRLLVRRTDEVLEVTTDP